MAAAKPEHEAEVKALRDKLAATEAALAKAQAEQAVVVGRITSAQPVELTFDTVSLVTATLANEAAVRTAKFEYLFVRISGATQARFGEILTEHEGRGWEYAGTTPLADPQRDVWVFRRPVAAAVNLSVGPLHYSAFVSPPPSAAPEPVGRPTAVEPGTPPPAPKPVAAPTAGLSAPTTKPAPVTPPAKSAPVTPPAKPAGRATGADRPAEPRAAASLLGDLYARGMAAAPEQDAAANRIGTFRQQLARACRGR